MKLLSAFLRLTRWPNLIFIALTQCLYFFCVVNNTALPPVQQHHFYLVVLASVFIAAGGYIINDYFDMHIDAVNKPFKVVVDKVLKRRWVILWHMLFSVIGVVLTAYASYVTHNWILLAGNILCVFLLWFYSTTFKKKLLIGNVIISALTAWVVLVLYLYCIGGLSRHIAPGGYLSGDTPGFRRLYKFTALYAGFAFIVSLIREVIKDLEDMEGDARYNCKTMPIVWGVPAAKVFAAVWLVVCIGALTLIQVYAWQLGAWLNCLYNIVFIIIPMLFILRSLYKAVNAADYHKLSQVVKFVMLTGILSMLFLKFFN